MSEDKRRERLRFRSWHRGTRELDLLLGSFADAQLAALTPEQLDEYEEILAINDPDVFSWMTEQKPVPPEHSGDVMNLIIAHRFAAEK